MDKYTSLWKTLIRLSDVHIPKLGYIAICSYKGTWRICNFFFFFSFLQQISLQLQSAIPHVPVSVGLLLLGLLAEFFFSALCIFTI